MLAVSGVLSSAGYDREEALQMFDIVDADHGNLLIMLSNSAPSAHIMIQQVMLSSSLLQEEDRSNRRSTASVFVLQQASTST